MKRVLVTGGTGYIGSHCCVALIGAGYHPIVFDNLSNSRIAVLDRIEAVTGHRPKFIEGDVRDTVAVEQAFSSRDLNSVMHFAGLKSANESTGKPIEYFDVNVSGTINVLSAMKKFGVKTIVFSSSATVYGDTDTLPINEDVCRQPTHPYGQSKMIAEDILETVAAPPDRRHWTSRRAMGTLIECRSAAAPAKARWNWEHSRCPTPRIVQTSEPKAERSRK